MTRLEHGSSGTVRPCRIFVSYAHLDEKPKQSRAWFGEGYPNAFIKYLRTFLRPLFRQDADDYVFFDAERLKKETEWEPAIENALAQCELFVFLVSVHSLSSKYCMRKELSAAVKRGVPIVPVVLTPIDGWTEHEIVDPDHLDHPPRRLGEFHSGGLPKDGDGNLLAVDQWSNEHLAWNKVCADIVAFIKAGLRPAGHPISRQVAQGSQNWSKGGIASDLLPYYCNQGPLLSRCRTDMAEWGKDEKNVLLLMLKGSDEDGMDRFARRMLLEVVQPRLPAHLAGLVPHRTLDWPHFNPRMPKDAEAQMADALLRALGLSPESADNGHAAEVLRMHLDARSDVPIVYIFLPEHTDSHKPGLSALLNLIESACPPRGRVILLLFIEDIAPLIAKPNLARVWGLNKLTRSVVVEPPALGLVTGPDATQWHRTQEIEQHFGIRLSELKARLFPDPAHTHRLRSFAEHFERLRAQPRGDPP